MPSIGTEQTPLGYGGALLQNLGPGDVYFGDDGLTTDDGYKITVGQAVAIGVRDNQLFAVATETSDVRELSRGLGVFTDMTIASASS